MTTFHIVEPQQKELLVVGRAVEAITELVDWKKAGDTERADWTICLTAQDASTQLGNGKTVLHVGMSRSDYPLETLSRQHPGRYHFTSSVGYNGHPAVVETILKLASIEGAAKQVAEVAAKAELTPAPDLKLPQLSPCPVVGLRISVIDDKELNRKSALVQLGAKNEVSEFHSYIELLRSLNNATQPRPDLILSDMIMPVEAYELGGKAHSTYLGSDIPAGIFVAFVAARAKVPRVIIQTDAGHHDHPALAMVDFLQWGREFMIDQTAVTIVRATVRDGVKDWGAGIRL